MEQKERSRRNPISPQNERRKKGGLDKSLNYSRIVSLLQRVVIPKLIGENHFFFAKLKARKKKESKQKKKERKSVENSLSVIKFSIHDDLKARAAFGYVIIVIEARPNDVIDGQAESKKR